MSLQIYIGPMFAGKTTKMINMFSFDRNKKIAIDYKDNSDEVTIESLYNHNNFMLEKTYKTKHLKSLWTYDNTLIQSQNIYINECQFFSDLKEFVLECLKKNKNVYLYGLDGDYKQSIFGQTFELIPYCDYIEKIKGMCHCCNNESLISYRTSSQKEQYLPNNDCYIPLCIKCREDMN